MNLVLSTLLIAWSIDQIDGHGRMLNPPGRGSMWRYGYPTEPNYTDNGLNCGGRGVQYSQNGGKCGICGDNYADPLPRENEHGGAFGRGIITNNYARGGIISVQVQLTASHLGHFEFSLCDMTNGQETEECFRPLTLVDGSSKFIVPDYNAGYLTMNLRLPKGVVCKHCVLRWHYRTANSLGGCGDGRSSTDCADQEIFRNCADISIV